MNAKVVKLEVGPWPMNCYLIVCETTQTSALLDPGAEAEKLMTELEGTHLDKIILTHTHQDHISAIAEIKKIAPVPVLLNPLEYESQTESPINRIDYDLPIYDGDKIQVGELSIQAIHTPGHTPGMTSFDLGDSRVLVGDTLFVGGPGKTWSPEDFEETMNTMREVVFRWADETEFYPGHGPSGIIGTERIAFESFLAKGWPQDLHGDVTWQ